MSEENKPSLLEQVGLGDSSTPSSKSRVPNLLFRTVVAGRPTWAISIPDWCKTSGVGRSEVSQVLESNNLSILVVNTLLDTIDELLGEEAFLHDTVHEMDNDTRAEYLMEAIVVRELTYAFQGDKTFIELTLICTRN